MQNQTSALYLVCCMVEALYFAARVQEHSIVPVLHVFLQEIDVSKLLRALLL